ncbi:MAG: class I SAM-dependent methyltransferase [Magnetococcales bacterium]|nr:class I SAM-dependent methyltransferase [Magnetococcales bacterium]
MRLLVQETRDGLSYRVIRCQACGVIQTWEQHAALSPDYRSLPPEEVDEARVWCQYQHKLPAFAQWEGNVAQHALLPPGPLLDVGCGTGGFLRHAAQRGWAPYGFDASLAQAEFARRYCPNARQATSVAEYREALAAPLPLMHMITLWDVLEHIRQPEALLSGLRDLLHPEGLLFISVPNGGALSWKKGVHRILGRPFSVDPWEHVFYYTRAALATHLATWGFRVVASGSVTCYPRPWSWFEMMRRVGFRVLSHLPDLSPQIYVLARKCVGSAGHGVFDKIC